MTLDAVLSRATKTLAEPLDFADTGATTRILHQHRRGAPPRISRAKS